MKITKITLFIAAIALAQSNISLANSNHEDTNSTTSLKQSQDQEQEQYQKQYQGQAQLQGQLLNSSNYSNSGANANGGNSTGSNSNSSTTNITSIKYPNQAPAIYTTSAPSFSQRNCTPVGSVNASGPFGGLGIAFPMGGDTCNAENLSDIMSSWIQETGDQRLWEVECEMLVEANDSLAEAFEKVKYSCHDAYITRISKLNANTKMNILLSNKH